MENFKKRVTSFVEPHLLPKLSQRTGALRTNRHNVLISNVHKKLRKILEVWMKILRNSYLPNSEDNKTKLRKNLGGEWGDVVLLSMVPTLRGPLRHNSHTPS